MRIALPDPGLAIPVPFPEINIITQPDHGIRAILVDGFEDLEIASIGLIGPIETRLIEVGTASKGDGEFGRIPSPLPQLLRLELQRIIEFQDLPVDDHRCEWKLHHMCRMDRG